MAFTTGYKVNEGTDYEFTVSKETINEAVQADGGITESDIADYCYSALIDSRIETVKAESHTDVQQSGWASWCQDHAMFYYVNNTRYITSNTGINNTSDKVYERNFLVWYGTTYPGEPEEKTGWFLIMDIKDIKRFYVDFSNAGFGQTTVASTRTDSGVTTPFTGYSGDAYTYNSSLANVYPNIYTDDDQITTIRVINVLNINDEFWIGRLNPSNYGEASTAYSSYGYAMYIDYKLSGWLSTSDSEHFFQKGTVNWVGIPKIIDMDYPDLGFDVSPVIRTYADSTDDMILDVSAEHYGGFPVVTSAVPACKTLDGILKWMSWCGLLFKYGGTTYKPIIQSGVVVGFSSNMFAPSEFDNMTNVTGNNISPTPPSGGGGTPGDWDDMPGAGSSIGALAGARCYICSKTDITNLKNWMSKTEADGGPPDGYDVLSSLISVMAFPIDMTAASSGPAQTISFTGLKTATDNQLANIAAALLSIANSVGATPKTEVKTFTSTATALPSAGNPFTVDLGTCDCPTFYSNDFPFADYDASVELYLPFIGTMTLDTQTVMGKSLHAYMSVDPITGAIYSWCECNKNGSRVVVAAGTGAIGVNTPITANQVGMAMAQIKNNAAQSRQTAIQSALTLGVGAIAGMDKNISSILSRNMTAAIGSRSANIAIATGRDYADALSVGASQAAMTALPNAIGANLNTGRANRQIAQANHNSISGSAGGSTADWSCSYRPYLKIITPDVHRAGDQYKHTYGIPTIQSGTLSSFKGLTFCANPDVSNISTATDQEKQQIFGLLAGGVYV